MRRVLTTEPLPKQISGVGPSSTTRMQTFMPPPLRSSPRKRAAVWLGRQSAVSSRRQIEGPDAWRAVIGGLSRPGNFRPDRERHLWLASEPGEGHEGRCAIAALGSYPSTPLAETPQPSRRR